MEVIEYEMPTAWDDKGMDWDAPDPANADYAMAIRQALLERCAALHTSPDLRVYRISPWKTVSREAMEGVVHTIGDIAGGFVNIGWEDFKEDYSDFPRMWSYRDLVMEPDCRLYEYAKYGSPVRNGGEWLRQVRNAIDRLTVIRAGQMFGRSVIRAGSRHDPPFDESIGDAMRMALESSTDSPHNEDFPSSIYAWSGNTHWKCPKPDHDGDNPEDNVDGYCGYARSLSYVFKAARSWLLGAQFDIFAAVLATSPTGPAPYSEQLDTSVFDGGESRFGMGLNWTGRVRVKDPFQFEFCLGDMRSIPGNEAVPKSEFDGEGNPTRRHSAKHGWEGRCWGFLDYGVEGGFRFRAKES